MDTGEQILRDFKANKLETLYKCLYPALTIFATSRLTPRFAFLAEDCVQDAVFAAYRKKHDFHSFLSFKSFLYTCVRNSAESILRKYRAGCNYLSGYEETDNGTPAEDIERIETDRAIFNAIDSLPENLRKTFELSFSEGLRNADVAERLGISVSAVKKRKAAIKLHLNKKIHGNTPKLVSLILFLTYFATA